MNIQLSTKALKVDYQKSNLISKKGPFAREEYLLFEGPFELIKKLWTYNIVCNFISFLVDDIRVRENESVVMLHYYPSSSYRSLFCSVCFLLYSKTNHFCMFPLEASVGSCMTSNIFLFARFLTGWCAVVVESPFYFSVVFLPVFSPLETAAAIALMLESVAWVFGAT